jgi:dCMP deaminase
MQPKKSNTPVWDIVTLFYPERRSLDIINKDPSRYYPEDHVEPNKLLGAEIEHIITKEVRRYPVDIITKLQELNILRMISQFVRYESVPYDYFYGMEIDMSFMEQYIDKRPSWDEYFMANAQLISARSTCDRLYVGCVLVRDNHIVAEGYNGSIAGHPHCDDVGHLEVEENGRIGCKRTVHAEKNALNMCAKLGIPVKGATAYVTHYPCPDCMKELNQAGVKEVVYGSFYQHRYENNFHDGMTLREFKGKKAKIEWVEEN